MDESLTICKKIPANGANRQNNDIKVSVTVLTYNHEKYIRQALDSILMQRTNFSYEALVGDDASHDGTPEILREYAEKYPQIIRLFLRGKNLGASRNAYELTIRARGEYLAALDGDDFWTDPDKLQIQADFLDAHKEFIGCVHDYETVDEEGRSQGKKRISWISEKKIFALKDFKGVVLPGHSLTIMKRNIFKEPQHDYTIVYKAHPMICDRTGALLYLALGSFFRIERSMGAYRRVRKKSGSNLTSTLYLGDEDHLYNDYLYTDRLQNYAESVLQVDGGFEIRKRELFAGVLCRFFLRPSREKFKIIKEMLKNAKCPALYLLFVPYNILKKFYIKFIYK
ncbi:glycosyltransferase [Synergistes jonesii]|uniref:glycosyltransferase n=1 Tax=Synergistes jonesii TaxID=2754 RepID=UPI0033181483